MCVIDFSYNLLCMYLLTNEYGVTISYIMGNIYNIISYRLWRDQSFSIDFSNY